MYSLSRILQRSHTLCIATSRAAYGRLESISNYIQTKEGVLVPSATVHNCQSFQRLYTRHVSVGFSIMSCALSSSTDAKSTGEGDDLEDGFPELETAASKEDNTVAGAEDVSLSETELSDDEDNNEETVGNELEMSDAEIDPSKKESPKTRTYSELYKVVISASGISVSTALDKWFEEGKDLSREEISIAMHNLRKRKMYSRALQLSEWLEANRQLEFIEPDYVCRLDLIAKVRGLHKAENYIEKIPESFMGDVVYRTLLANCVVLNNVEKAKEFFKKMQDLKLPISTFACNQLLLLYRRHDRKKIPDILLVMEKENLKPSRLTYKVLIDAKGLSGDMAGIDQILETMKAEGVEPDLKIQTSLASIYAAARLKDKAIAVLKELEGEGIKVNPWACRSLLTLYGELGEADQVARIWNFCEQNPRFEECMAAIEAFGKLKKIKEAEAVFETLQKLKRPSSKPFYALLKAYADNKMLTKGKDLAKRMADSGCPISPLASNELVKLYVEAGEVEKADSILNTVMQQSQMKPLYNSFMLIFEQFAKRGDVHNSEKIFHRMREAGYVARHRQYQALVLAYANAKAPAYGMRERMKADNLFPNKLLAAQLAQVDAFRNTPLSDLLD